MKKGFPHLWLAAAMLAGCMVSMPAMADRIYVRVAPPAPIAEVRVARPSAHHIWIPGFHRWDGRAYAWVPGRWDLPPRPHAAWVRGHWRHSRHGWYWVEGHWR